MNLTPPPSCDFATGYLHWNCIPDYIVMISAALVSFVASICVLLLMYNGFRYMLGPVTEGSTDNAKKGIRYSIIGLVICILAYVIVDLVVQSVTP